MKIGIFHLVSIIALLAISPIRSMSPVTLAQLIKSIDKDIETLSQAVPTAATFNTLKAAIEHQIAQLATINQQQADQFKEKLQNAISRAQLAQLSKEHEALKERVPELVRAQIDTQIEAMRDAIQKTPDDQLFTYALIAQIQQIEQFFDTRKKANVLVDPTIQQEILDAIKKLYASLQNRQIIVARDELSRLQAKLRNPDETVFSDTFATAVNQLSSQLQKIPNEKIIINDKVITTLKDDFLTLKAQIPSPEKRAAYVAGIVANWEKKFNNEVAGNIRINFNQKMGELVQLKQLAAHYGDKKTTEQIDQIQKILLAKNFDYLQTALLNLANVITSKTGVKLFDDEETKFAQAIKKNTIVNAENWPVLLEAIESIDKLIKETVADINQMVYLDADFLKQHGAEIKTSILNCNTVIEDRWLKPLMEYVTDEKRSAPENRKAFQATYLLVMQPIATLLNEFSKRGLLPDVNPKEAVDSLLALLRKKMAAVE